MKAKLISALLLSFMLVAAMPAKASPEIDVSQDGVVYNWEPVFSDDFSADSGRWDYMGSANRNAGGYMRLTPAAGGQVGVAWFDTPVDYDFTVEFDLLIGGGSGADGMVFMFYKDTAYEPGTGGALGFCDYPDSVEGYGVEFDTYYNDFGNEPGARYVGIIEDHVSNHLGTAFFNAMRDNTWRHIKVVVEREVDENGVPNPDNTFITVYVGDMDVPLIEWNGAIDRDYSGFGFGAGTGGLTDNHYIDNVQLTQKKAYIVKDGRVIYEVVFVQGEVDETVEELQAEASPRWTVLAGDTALLAIALLVVILVARGLRKKKE